MGRRTGPTLLNAPQDSIAFLATRPYCTIWTKQWNRKVELPKYIILIIIQWKVAQLLLLYHWLTCSLWTILCHRLTVHRSKKTKPQNWAGSHQTPWNMWNKEVQTQLRFLLSMILSTAGEWDIGSPGVFTVPYSKYHQNIIKLVSPS